MKYFFALLLPSLFVTHSYAYENRPSSFKDVKTVIPSIEVDIRYSTNYNFTGQPVKGYNANICYLHKDVIRRLKKVQDDLIRKNLSLKVYDCYRPQEAVNSFVTWSQDTKIKGKKLSFFPNIKKNQLFKKKYLAKESKHSKGIAIDLTIVKTGTSPTITFYNGKEKDCTITSISPNGENTLEMGTTYDCLDQKSHTLSSKVSKTALANRLLLKKYMTRHGFKNYSKEWWHYTLPEVNIKKYYNFEIK